MIAREVAREEAPARGLRLALFTDTYAPQVNGVSRTLERLVAAVESRGGAVHVETVEVPGALDDPRVHRVASVPFWAYPQLRIATPSTRAATERIRRFAPTLVHATTPFGVGLTGRRVARRLGVPFVTSYHTSFSAYLAHYGLSALDGVAWPYLRWFHDSGRRTFVPSRAVRDELARHGFRGLRIWSRGVDAARFSPAHRSRAMRARMGAHDGTFVVAYVGRLAPEKGVHRAIEAMRLVLARHPGTVRFVLAGDGPDEARCRTEAPEGTWFAGALHGEELSRFYASADAFLFPSRTETFGNVVLEAMASGLPVVAPDTGATLEYAHEGTALTFPGDDPHAMAGRIEWLLRDHRLRHQLRTAGIAAAETRAWDGVWDRLVADYREAIAQPGDAPVAARPEAPRDAAADATDSAPDPSPARAA